MSAFPILMLDNSSMELSIGKDTGNTMSVVDKNQARVAIFSMLSPGGLKG